MEPNENKAYLYDLYKYYYCISYRLIEYMNKVNNYNQIDKIKKILDLFKKNKVKTSKSFQIEIINKSISYYLDYMKSINELNVFFPYKNKKIKKSITEDLSLPLIVLGTVTIITGFLVKMSNYG